MGKWIFISLFGGISLLIMGLGIYQVHDQDVAIRNAEPVDVLITRSWVESYTRTSKGKTTTHYRPRVEYQYYVADRQFSGDRIHPAGAMEDRANETVARFPSGTEARGWRDRDDPSRSFLIREYDFGPYFMTLLGMVFVGASGIISLGMLSDARAPAPPTPRASGWFELSASMTLRTRFRICLAMAVLCVVVGGGACWHFFHKATPPYPSSAIWLASIFAALSLVPVILLVINWLLLRGVCDAVVLLDHSPVQRGRNLTVRVAIPLMGGSAVESATVTLDCTETYRAQSGGKSRSASRNAWQREQDIAPPQDVLSDRTIEGELVFNIPANAPATSRGPRHALPRYDWLIRVRVKRAGPDYKAKFTVVVV